MRRRKTTGKSYCVVPGYHEVELVCGHWATVYGWIGSFRQPKTATCRKCAPPEKTTQPKRDTR